MRAQFLLAALQAARVGAVGGADSKCYAHRYKDVCDAFCGTPDRCDLRKVPRGSTKRRRGTAAGAAWIVRGRVALPPRVPRG